MSHRIFRLSISPDDSPAVRRVIDFDGRHSLHDVHTMMHATLSIDPDDDHLYAFFLSGRYWDKASEYVDPRTDGLRADQALLFRLHLRAGQRFVYVYDYGTEHRYSLSVVSVTEADAALPSPLLIESVGNVAPFDESPREEGELDQENEEGELDPELKRPTELATGVLKLFGELEALGESADVEQTQPLLSKLAEATLVLMLAIDENLQLLSAVDRKCNFQLLEILLELPRSLSAANETALSVRVAEALRFCAPDEMKGEIALAYAKAGDRERALRVVLENLESATEPFVAEQQAGDVYRKLGEADAAEAYYRRALAIAETALDRGQATLRLTSLMVETGREADAAAFVEQQRAARAPATAARTQLPSVGRNDPCPCGSGKKYKKCHGA